jgi:dipeptidyl aminopeptidase/acylaminoacyl peptidase
MRTTRLIAALLIFLSLAGVAVGQQPKPSVDGVINSLLARRDFGSVAISPDGKRVAWVEKLHERSGAATPNSVIQVEDLEPPSPPHRVSAGSGDVACAEHSVAWSPDSRQLAFLSDAEKRGQLQLYVADAAGGPSRKLTELTGFLTGPRWSPDGKTLAILFIENAPRVAGPLEAMTKDAGVVEQHIFEQRLTTVDINSRRVRHVSPADLYVYEYDWAPDGTKFVATAAHGAGDSNWYLAELYTVDSGSGETRSIYKPPLQIAAPRWSPDGKSIAFIAGLMSDEGNTGGDIFVLPATGGEPRNLTPGMKASAGWIAWLPLSKEILFAELVDGSSGVAKVDAADGKITVLWAGPETISAATWGVSASLARDGRSSAVIRESFEQPPEVWAGPVGAWKQVTHFNSNISSTLGKAQSIHWASSDGMAIQGWLIFPPNYDPARRYPLIVLVHGGPGSAVLPTWPGAFSWTAALSSQGYLILMPNFRGSFGQGEAFTQANVKDFGYGDFRDIVAGVEEVVKKFSVEEDRIGVTGWSYGGYMSMWAVTQTRRFRAAVAGAGIANWQSYYGENDIDQWMIPFFGASVYDDPAVYARSSPITFIKNVKTPTLILVGDSDGECPPPQSYEFWHALKTLGVETQFVIYPNEGHAIHDPEHQRDIVQRAVAWFDRYLR